MFLFNRASGEPQAKVRAANQTRLRFELTGQKTVLHFRNEAAKRRCVAAGKVTTDETKPVAIRTGVYTAERKPPRKPRNIPSLPLGDGSLTPLEFATLYFDAAQISQRGFRTPGKRSGSTSLVEQAAIRAGIYWDDAKAPKRKDSAPFVPTDPSAIPLKHLHAHARLRRLAQMEAA